MFESLFAGLKNSFGGMGIDLPTFFMPPTPGQLAKAAQKERRKQARKQGTLSTVLSMGTPLNPGTGNKTLLGG